MPSQPSRPSRSAQRRPARVVLITGAGSGIGLASAIHFAREGWRIGLVGRGDAALADAERQVRAAGGETRRALADVSDSAALAAAAVSIEAALGPIDVWVNNAGIGFYGAFVDVPEDAFRQVIDVNLHGTVNGTRIALGLMRPRGRGVIVQVLSAISYRGVPLQSAYSASKYGLRGFTEAVRSELFAEGSPVHVTMVHPPAVNTPFYSHAGSVMEDAPRPPPPLYQPEILGEAIFRAATERRREWRVGESTLAFSIGNKLFPDLMDAAAGPAGVATQRTRSREAIARRDPNTFAAAARPSGAHGPFDAESLSFSPAWEFVKAPAAARFALAALALGLVVAGALRRR